MNQYEKKRDSYLRRKYGISLSDYKELYRKQKGYCPICQKHRREFNKDFAVDHDHISGEIRGLLCSYCNRYIVGRHRDSEKMMRVSKYLKRHTGYFIPKRKPKRKRK